MFARVLGIVLMLSVISPGSGQSVCRRVSVFFPHFFVFLLLFLFLFLFFFSAGAARSHVKSPGEVFRGPYQTEVSFTPEFSRCTVRPMLITHVYPPFAVVYCFFAEGARRWEKAPPRTGKSNTPCVGFFFCIWKYAACHLLAVNSKSWATGLLRHPPLRMNFL